MRREHAVIAMAVCRRGGGTKAASRSRNSRGARESAVCPSGPRRAARPPPRSTGLAQASPEPGRRAGMSDIRVENTLKRVPDGAPAPGRTNRSTGDARAPWIGPGAGRRSGPRRPAGRMPARLSTMWRAPRLMSSSCTQTTPRSARTRQVSFSRWASEVPTPSPVAFVVGAPLRRGVSSAMCGRRLARPP